MSLKRAVLNVSTGLQGMRTKLDASAHSMTTLQKNTTSATNPLNQLKNGSGQAATAVGRLRTAANNGDSAVRKLTTGLRTADASFTKSKGGSDKLTSSLDKLKSSANSTKTALRGVKQQADAVEKAVGKAGKNADKGGKSMGNLGKGHTGSVWAPVSPGPVFLYNNDAGTTTSTTPAETLTSAAGDPLVAGFFAPPSGQVIVTVGALMFNSSATTCYMGATIRKVSDGSVFLASTIDRAAMINGTERASTSSQFLVSSLTAGAVYSATPTYWSAVPTTTNTANYDNRFIRVDPVH